MIKVKDGYAKLIGTTYSGSAARLLLSNGGDKAVSDFAASSHTHSASDITSGTLSVSRGGTGATSFTSGAVLIGNGTGAVSTRSITSSATKDSTSLITSGGVYSALAGKMNASITSIELNTSGGLKSYGGFIDFHFHDSNGTPLNASGEVTSDGKTPDYTSRIIEDAAGTISVNGVKLKDNKVTASKGFVGNLTGVADSAINLSNKPSLLISGNTIAVKAGEKTSDYITVPYATSAYMVSSYEVASSSNTKRRIWIDWTSKDGKVAYSDDLTYQTDIKTLFAPYVYGKITVPGGSYSWYQVQQYNSSNANPSYYDATCAIVNINSYTGWQPWIRGVDSENGSWTIGQYTTNLHIGYIPKSNTTNGLTYKWDFGKDGSTIFPGSIKFNKILIPTSSGGTTYGAGTSGQVLKSNGTTVYWASDSNSNTWRAIQVNGTQIAGTSTGTKAVNFVSGTGVTVTGATANPNTVTMSLTASGVTAGSYGPSANVTGSNNATMSVPYITVDTYGRITSISNKTYTAKNNTYSAFTGATSSAAGSSGLVPAPTKGTHRHYLRGDGLWVDGSAIINALSEGASNATRNDYIVAQYAGGGTTTTSYHRRKLSNIFAALNASDVTTALGYTPYNSTNPAGYITSSGSITGNAATATNASQLGGVAARYYMRGVSRHNGSMDLNKVDSTMSVVTEIRPSEITTTNLPSDYGTAYGCMISARDGNSNYGHGKMQILGCNKKFWMRATQGAGESNDGTWCRLALTSDIPSELKNPNAIKFKNTAGTEKSYDGSSALDLTGGINYAASSGSATKVSNYYASRPTSIAPGVSGDGSMFHFKCTSSVTDTTTDPGDSHILHFNWDNNGGYDFQIACLTSSSTMKIRGMSSKSWLDWATVLTSSNYTSYVKEANFPGINKTGTVTSVATGTGLTGGTITSSGTISINSTYQTYISNGNTAYGWGNHANAGYIKSTSILKGWSDTRNAATKPNDYNGAFKVIGIKSAGTTLGLTSTQAGSYATIIGWRGWSDSSGGYAWEIASTDKNRLYVRSGSTTSWNNGWQAIAYTSEIPTKTSQLTNDSGYLTSLPSHNHDGRYAWGNYASQSELSDCNNVSSTGFWTHSGFTNRPTDVKDWGSLMNIRLYNSNNNYHRQLFFDCYGSDYVWTRSDVGGTWTSWKRLALASEIPSVGNGTVTINQAGASKGSFTLNQSTAATINLTDTNYYHTPSYSSGLSIASGTGVNAMYVPNAGASQSGVVSTGAQTFAGEKTFSSIRLRSTSTTNYGGYLYFGDGSYSYITEPSDDAMTIYSSKGVTISTSNSTTGTINLKSALSNRTSANTSYPGVVCDGMYLKSALYHIGSVYKLQSSTAISVSYGYGISGVTLSSSKPREGKCTITVTNNSGFSIFVHTPHLVSLFTDAGGGSCFEHGFAYIQTGVTFPKSVSSGSTLSFSVIYGYMHTQRTWNTNDFTKSNDVGGFNCGVYVSRYV